MILYKDDEGLTSKGMDHNFSFKYYHDEKENPYPNEDIRSNFWYGEMMLSNLVKRNSQEGNNPDSFKSLINDAKKWKKEINNANNPHHDFAERYSDKQMVVIFYIALLFGKWSPYDNLEWIFEY